MSEVSLTGIYEDMDTSEYLEVLDGEDDCKYFCCALELKQCHADS